MTGDEASGRRKQEVEKGCPAAAKMTPALEDAPAVIDPSVMAEGFVTLVICVGIWEKVVARMIRGAQLATAN